MISALKKADLQSGALSNVLINNTEYDFNVILINPEGRFFAFRPESIKDLTIYDTISQYYCFGYMVFDNSYDVLERPPITANTEDPLQAQNVTKSYSFRGDARDILRIQITPRLNPNNASSENDNKVKEVFCLNYEFMVYDIEDSLLEQPDSKLRKLYFHDAYHQILLEKNVQFSTADIASKNSQASSNTDRSIKTGAAIKALLNKTFPESEGFDIKFSEFDVGSTDIFFTSPANYKAADSLEYLLDRHVCTASNNFDKAYLKIERYPRTWSLTSLKQMFDKAYVKSNTNDSGGQLYLERFLLGGAGDGDKVDNLQVTVTRSPNISLYFVDNNTIENFSFLPPPGNKTQKHLVSKLVHSYRNSEKAFYIDSENNDLLNVLEAYRNNYVNNLKGEGGKPVSNIVTNSIRSTRQNVTNIFTTSDKSPEQRLSVGRSDTLRDAIFLNKAISFRVKGATYRQSGYFISIDRNNSLTDSSFDDKLLGIYLIVDVRHTFIGNTYYNDLVCVKTYNYKDTGDSTGNYF